MPTLLISCADLAGLHPPRLLVKPHSTVSLHELDAILAKYAARRVGVIEQIQVHVVELSPQSDARAVAAELGKNPQIEFAEPDARAAPSTAQ